MTNVLLTISDAYTAFLCYFHLFYLFLLFKCVKCLFLYCSFKSITYKALWTLWTFALYKTTIIIIIITDLGLEALEVPHVEVAACVEEEGVGHGHVEDGVEEHGQVIGPLTMGYQQLDDARAALLVLLELVTRGHLLHQVTVACLHATHHHERVTWLEGDDNTCLCCTTYVDNYYN